MFYAELEKRNSKQMSKVISTSSYLIVLLYIVTGIIGYACFASTKDGINQLFNLCAQNIFQADFDGSIPIQIANIANLLASVAITPLCILPSKDTVEELFYK